MTEIINNEQNQSKEFEEAIKHVQEELQKNQFSEDLIVSLKTCESILSEKQTIAKYDAIAAFFEEEGLTLPSDFQDKKDVHVKEEENQQSSLPGQIDTALENITNRNILKFIGHFESRKNLPQFDYFVKHLSDDNKEKIYHAIRAEEIPNPEERTMVARFEEKIGYNHEFSKKHLYKGVDADTEEVLEFVMKHTPGYSKAVNDTLRWMKQVRNAVLNEDSMNRYVNTALRRFEITAKDLSEEELKAIALELFAIFTNYFPNYQGEKTPSQS